MKRRPHWDDALIESLPIPGHSYLEDEDIYAIIAAVEDWQDANGFSRAGTLMHRLITAEATIQRVRELHYNTATHHPSGCCSECGGTYPCPTVRAFDGGAE
mgnify:CR=1 FL=1